MAMYEAGELLEGLCPPCQSFLRAPSESREIVRWRDCLDPVYWIPHHSTMQDLERCTGCQLCAILRSRLPGLGQPVPLATWSMGIQIIRFHDEDVIYVAAFDGYAARFFTRPLWIVLGLTEDAHDRLKTLGSSTSTDETIALASSWLRTCSSERPTCGSLSTSSLRLPTRLISISDPSQTPSARIERGEYLPPHTSYLALSHCWGKTPFFTLNAENEEDLMKSIPLGELPKTFLDAIDITRRLGYRYLWIDSLCIVQGSEGDWHAESSSMADVFQNSALTIAAFGSSQASDGCFQKRQQWLFSLPWNPFKFLKWSSVCISALEPHLLFFHGTRGRGLPLQKRGWALQEMVLSPRFLHFNSLGIFYQCLNSTLSESVRKNDCNRRTLKTSTPRLEERQSRSTLQNEWQTLVEDYSSRDLSYPDTDKLVALSGLARMYGQLINERYFAGVWENRIHRGLCWKTLHPEQHTRPKNYRSPSWSWAAVDSAVSFSLMLSREREESLVTVKAIHVDLVTQDPMGQVKGGHITIAGFPIQGYLYISPRGLLSSCVFKPYHEPDPTCYYLVYLDYAISDLSISVWCFPMFCQEIDYFHRGAYTRFVGLLLESAASESHDITVKFRRLGVFTASYTSGQPFFLDGNNSRELTII